MYSFPLPDTLDGYFWKHSGKRRNSSKWAISDFATFFNSINIYHYSDSLEIYFLLSFCFLHVKYKSHKRWLHLLKGINLSICGSPLNNVTVVCHLMIYRIHRACKYIWFSTVQCHCSVSLNDIQNSSCL